MPKGKHRGTKSTKLPINQPEAVNKIQLKLKLITQLSILHHLLPDPFVTLYSHLFSSFLHTVFISILLHILPLLFTVQPSILYSTVSPKSTSLHLETFLFSLGNSSSHHLRPHPSPPCNHQTPPNPSHYNNLLLIPVV